MRQVDDEMVTASEREALATEESWLRERLREAGRRPEMPDDDRAAIEAAVRAQWEQLRGERTRDAQRGRFRSALPPLWQLAAAAVLLVAGALAFWWQAERRPGRGRAEALPTLAVVERIRGAVSAAVEASDSMRALAPGEALAAGALIVTGAGADSPASVALRLASGVALRLDADSRVRLLSPGAVRLERGALYVDSGGAVEAGAQIVVETAAGEVREIGTQFEVRLDAAEPAAIRVRVREGEIALRRGGLELAASAGEELAVDGAGALQRRAVSRQGAEWAWAIAAAPGFEIDGRTLGAFLRDFERESGWRVEIVGSELQTRVETIWLHGSVAGLTPDQALEVVLPGTGLTYRIGEALLRIEAEARPGR